ncbi:MAG: hypothetical protein KAY24_17960 [Candidatus Eisenbacteria sp.]|nr:hypothetical protein [Candidatus Eisenbacteria bacterium]
MSSAHEIVNVLRIVWVARKTVTLVTLAAVVVATLVSLVLPHGFKARTTILPSENEGASMAGQLAAVGANLPAGLITLPTTPEAIFVEMLGSRIVRTGVVRELDLLTVYGIDAESPDLAMELALKKLGRQVKIARKQSGLIAINVIVRTPCFPFLYKDPDARARRLAAEIANTMVLQLDRVHQERGASQARNSRIYLEGQLKRTRQELETGSDSLVAFQKRHAAISIDEQARVIIETLGVLKGQILAKEIEVEVLQKSRTQDTFDLQRAQVELAALRQRHRQLLRGDDQTRADKSSMGDRPSQPDDQDFYVPVVDLPDIAMELSRLTREVAIQQTVYELLTQQYYQAMLEEVRDIPTVQVLDVAIPPVVKASPKRKLIVLLAFLGGLLAGSIWVSVRSGAWAPPSALDAP